MWGSLRLAQIIPNRPAHVLIVFSLLLTLSNSFYCDLDKLRLLLLLILASVSKAILHIASNATTRQQYFSAFILHQLHKALYVPHFGSGGKGGALKSTLQPDLRRMQL